MDPQPEASGIPGKKLVTAGELSTKGILICLANQVRIRIAQLDHYWIKTLEKPSLSLAKNLAHDVFELPNGLQLAVVVVRPGTPVGILQAVEGIKAQALPELMAAGPVELIDGFALEIGQAALQVFDLGHRHRRTRALQR